MKRLRCCRRGRTGSSCSTCPPASRPTRTRASRRRCTDLARSHGRFGLVLFSDTAYQTLPPGTPAANCCRSRASSTFRRRRARACTGAAAEPVDGLLQRGHADLGRPRNSRSTWSANEQLRRPRVLLVSDLDDDTGDLAASDDGGACLSPRRHPAARRRPEPVPGGRAPRPRACSPGRATSGSPGCPARAGRRSPRTPRGHSRSSTRRGRARCSVVFVPLADRLRWRPA